jgi:heme a synthase
MLERFRSWRPSPTTLQRVFLGALVMNAVIVVTGGAVRLTASGLGCPTFPRCTSDSLVVTRELGGHGAIEFGNRMLTFVLSVAVAAAIITAWRARRRDLLRLSWLLFVGIVAQAVLGGITVLTGLNPVTVMAHFLLSMGLIVVATLAFERAAGTPVPQARLVRREVAIGGRLLVGVVAMTLFLGTVVTGSGPHSGDKNATHRLPFDLLEVTQLHADFVFLLFGLTVGVLLALQVTDAPSALRRRAVVLLVIALAQGTVGYVQYATDLPVALVAGHVLGACLVWIAALRVLLGMTARVAPVSAAVAVPGARPEAALTGSSPAAGA